MKYYPLITLCLFLATKITAQENAIAKIHYVFKHINDTTRRDVPQKDDVVSYLGTQSYFYTTLSDQRMKKEIELQKSITGFDGQLTLPIKSTPILEQYIISPSEQKTQNIQGISSTFDAYLLEGEYEPITWLIDQQERKIGGYTCQKATTRFGGRHYTAWFSTEIPFPFGPWKLHGLPGLILEASDDKQEVIFEYAGFDKLREAVPIAAPHYVLPTTQKEFARLRQAFQDNSNAYYATLHSGGKMNVVNSYFEIDYTTMSISFDRTDYQPSTDTNNPIVLDNKE